MSIFNSLVSTVVNPANIGLALAGPGGWAALAARTLGSAIGQEVIQMLGEKFGLPQSMIDAAQASFCAACGDKQGVQQNIREAVQSLAQDYGLSPMEQGQLERAARQDSNDMFEKLADAFKSGKEMAETRKSRGGGRSWLQVIADSMAQALDNKVKDMDRQAKALDKQGSNKSVKASTDLQVAGQEFSYLMNASSTVIKTIGEGLASMARKQ